MTPPNASPQPILPGVPVPFPCWILVTYRPLAASHPYWHYQDSETDILCYTHYLVAPATADPATFPKAEGGGSTNFAPVAQKSPITLAEGASADSPPKETPAQAGEVEQSVSNGEVAGSSPARGSSLSIPPSAGTEQKERGEADRIANNLHACLDNRDRLAKLTRLQLIAATLGSDAADYDVVVELMNRVLPHWEQLHDKTIDAAVASLPSPVDGTTTPTPRTDAQTAAMQKRFSSEESESAYYAMCDFARTLERELSLAEKRLGEAQGELHQVRNKFGRAESSVVEASIYFPNVGDYIKQVETQLATSQARLVEVEGERDAYRAVMVQVVPGEHGEGVEQPASPEHIKAHIDYLQKEWDGAEAALAQAKQELSAMEDDGNAQAKLVADLSNERNDLRAANAQLQALPDRVSDIVEWMNAQKQTIRDYVALRETAQLQREKIDELSAQLQAGEADKRRLDWLEAKRADLHCNTSGGWWLWAKNIEVQDRASARLAIDGAIEIDADKGAGS